MELSFEEDVEDHYSSNTEMKTWSVFFLTAQTFPRFKATGQLMANWPANAANVEGEVKGEDKGSTFEIVPW